MVGTAAVVGYATLGAAYRHHRRSTPLALLTLGLLFIIQFYAVTAVAFGEVNPTLLTPEPIWNPLQWNMGWLNETLQRLRPGGG